MAGRPRGPLQGDTEQASALAQWLRDITADKTTRELAAETMYQKTSWNDLLNGVKLPPRWLLNEVVQKCVPEPLWEEKLREGAALLRRAEQAAAGKEVDARALQISGTESELAVRLDNARIGQLEAERALFAVNNLVFHLAGLLVSLTNRCRDLEAQVKVAEERGRQEALSALAGDLQESEDRQKKAAVQLEAARKERQQAEDIRVAALLIVEQHVQAMAARTGRDAPVGEQPQEADPATPPQAGPVNSSVPLHEYDWALENTEDRIAVLRTDLDRLREQVAQTTDGLSAPPQTDNGQSEAAHVGYVPEPNPIASEAAQPYSYSWDAGYQYDTAPPYLPTLGGDSHADALNERVVAAPLAGEPEAKDREAAPSAPMAGFILDEGWESEPAPWVVDLGRVPEPRKKASQRGSVGEAATAALMADSGGWNRLVWHPLRGLGWRLSGRAAMRTYRTAGLLLCWVPAAFTAGVVGIYMERAKSGGSSWISDALVVVTLIIGLAASNLIIRRVRRSAYLAYINFLGGGDPLPPLLGAARPMTVLATMLMWLLSNQELGPWRQITRSVARLLWSAGSLSDW